MSINLNEIYLRKDLTEIISEKFAKRYNIDLSKWIKPFGYYNERGGSIICNSTIPDGVYLVLGRVEYPNNKEMSYHVIYQFNLCKSRGLDLRWASRFNPYPNVPKNIKLSPNFAMFKIAECIDYNQCKKIYNEIKNTAFFTSDQLKDIIKKEPEGSFKDTIYKLRLALQREIDRDRRIY